MFRRDSEIKPRGRKREAAKEIAYVVGLGVGEVVRAVGSGCRSVCGVLFCLLLLDD